MGRAHNHNKFCSVEHIPFADEITLTVEKFAVENRVAFDSYYHDLPVWLVHEHKADKGKTRRLQLTAYLVGNDVHLSLVPSVHIFTDEDTVLVPKKVEPERFDLADFVAADGTFGHDLLHAKISASWERAAAIAFGPEELLTVQLPKTIQVNRPGPEPTRSKHTGPLHFKLE